MIWFFLLFEGVYNYQVEEDISKLKLCVNSLLQEYSLNVNVKDDYIHELYVLCIVSSQLFSAERMVILQPTVKPPYSFCVYICNLATMFPLTSYPFYSYHQGEEHD